MDFEAKRAYEHVEVFDDMDKTGMIEFFAHKLHLKFHFTNIIALNEEDILRAARLRRSFGIENTAQTVKSILRYRDKIIMKQILTEKKVKVPKFAEVNNCSDIMDFVNNNGYPFVLKPRKGYGSVSTSVVKNEEDLIELLKNINPGVDSELGLDIECFQNGEMYHIDGIVYDGKITCVWPSKYVNTVVNFKDNRFIAGYSLSPNNPLTKRLQEFIVSVIDALGGPSCFPFHAEAWHEKKSEDIVLCEIASRTGGGGIRWEILELFGIMLDKTNAQWQCSDFVTNENLSLSYKERVPVVPFLVGWIFVYPQVGKLVSTPSTCELDYCIGFYPFGQNGDIYKDRSSCADAVVSILVKGDTEEQVEKNIHEICKWYDETSKWEDL